MSDGRFSVSMSRLVVWADLVFVAGPGACAGVVTVIDGCVACDLTVCAAAEHSVPPKHTHTPCPHTQHGAAARGRVQRWVCGVGEWREPKILESL